MEKSIEISNVCIELSEEYIERLAKRLRWRKEDVISNFGCKKTERGYVCCAFEVKNGKIIVYPYTLGLIKGLSDAMYRKVR